MPKILPYEIEAGALAAVESAAIAAYEFVGAGDELSADQVAIDAMHNVLNGLQMRGRIAVGEGDEGEAPKLYENELIGEGVGREFDIALDALEGTTLAAKAMQNALSVIAIAPKGALFHAPNIYMEKIAIGPNFPKGIINLDDSPQENVRRVAAHKGVEVSRIGVCVLDRPRHSELIAQLREIGARIYLIPDGDVAGIIFTTEPTADVDLYMGIGGAPEGVLAAAALSCVGGQFEGRLITKSEDDKRSARHFGIDDLSKKYSIEDIVKGEVVFAACGVTNGTLLRGVRYRYKGIETETLLFDSQSRTARKIVTLRSKTSGE